MIEIEILLTFVYFLECTVVQCKGALFIYWNRHGHECSRIGKLSANFTLIQCIKIVSRFVGPRYIGTTFLGPNLVSFNRTLVISLPPYCTRVSKDTGSSSCERKIFMPSVYSLFRTSGYLGQIIISLVVKEVKHSPFWLGKVDRSHR
jgi:hypothetical protein